MQPLLPAQRRADDVVEVVVVRRPSESVADALRVGDEDRRIARASAFLAHDERTAVRALDRRDHLAHAVSVPVAAVERERLAARAQVVAGEEVCRCEILDVNVVAHAGAVGRRIISAEDRDVRPLADRSLTGDLRQQRRIARRLSDPPARIRTGDVEVAQDDVAQAACRGDQPRT